MRSNFDYYENQAKNPSKWMSLEVTRGQRSRYKFLNFHMNSCRSITKCIQNLLKTNCLFLSPCIFVSECFPNDFSLTDLNSFDWNFGSQNVYTKEKIVYLVKNLKNRQVAWKKSLRVISENPTFSEKSTRDWPDLFSRSAGDR